MSLRGRTLPVVHGPWYDTKTHSTGVSYQELPTKNTSSQTKTWSPLKTRFPRVDKWELGPCCLSLIKDSSVLNLSVMWNLQLKTLQSNLRPFWVPSRSQLVGSEKRQGSPFSESGGGWNLQSLSFKTFFKTRSDDGLRLHVRKVGTINFGLKR